ncbi:hypothetical protein FE257_012282 [Aspergillus nanangensis]|uniref:BZIP domain-containing protein n=1 Tax=Aspergillus nanangensis TaxID=2582783 RepID=A0AAD4CFZ9_ASPNN|nr:hypothetical protein FE257_012282 [Aspergillus nanangensis]
MSQISPISGSLSDDALRAEHRGSLEKKRPLAEDSSSEGHDPVRPRPRSWQPSAPVEPPLKPAQLRSIEVHSILNPPTQTVPAIEAGREAVGEQLSNSPSHQRLPSSPSVRLPSPSIHPRRLSASPGMRSRQIIHPSSPSARFVGPGGHYSRRASASQSPLAQESRPGLYSVAPGSPLPVDPTAGLPGTLPGNQPSIPVSIQSTPTFHSRRTSVNPTPNSSSQETSPSTPVSTYSQFGRSSPAISGGLGLQGVPGFPQQLPYGGMEPMSRLPSVMGPARPAGEETAMAGSSQSETGLAPGMIPCILDLKSGSSSQAEKRKANSDASRRFRNRKRNEMQMEQKITSQQDEIRKQTEVLQRQDQEMRALIQEREFYRSERDFYRDHISRLVPASQIPARPASPQAFRSSLDKPGPDRDQPAWHGVEPTTGPSQAASTVPPMPSSRPPGTWSSAPSAYTTSQPAHPERGTLGEDPARTLPQFPGTWTRNA